MDESRRSTRIRPRRFLIGRIFEMGSSFSHGALVQDVSQGGVGLLFTRPPRDLQGLMGIELPGRAEYLLGRFVHGLGQPDGTYRAGLQFVNPLEAGEVDAIIH